MKLQTTLRIVLIGGAALFGAGWMALPALQGSQRKVGNEAARQLERARRILNRFDPAVERTSLLLDSLAEVGADVDVEDPDALAEEAADSFQQESESAWAAYQPMDWDQTPPVKARATFGNIADQMRNAISERAALIEANRQWLDEALDAVNGVLALSEGNADARSYTEANRLKSVIQFHKGLMDWQAADARRRDADGLRAELIDIAAKVVEYRAGETLVANSGVNDRIAELREREVAARADLETRRSILTDLDRKIADIEGRIAEATRTAQAAEKTMHQLHDQGADLASPSGMEAFRQAYSSAEQSFRRAQRRLQALRAGDYSDAVIQPAGEYLDGKYAPEGSSGEPSVEFGLWHYRNQRETLAAEISVLEENLADQHSAIERMEGLSTKLKEDSDRAESLVPTEVAAASEVFTALNEAESDAFAIEEDALETLENAARLANTAVGNAQRDVSSAGERLSAAEDKDKSAFSLLDGNQWLGGHITAQIADARLAMAWIHFQRFKAYTRTAEVLANVRDLLHLAEADVDAERTKAKDAHDAGVAEIMEAMDKLQDAHRFADKHWTFVAQQGAADNLMAMFGHPEYLEDAISAYRNAVSGREDEPFAEPFTSRLSQLESR